MDHDDQNADCTPDTARPHLKTCQGVLRMMLNLYNFEQDILKKLIPILLLGLFLFNCFGYRFLMSYLEDRSNQQMEEQLDNNNYDDAQLISIKVPISYLPYYKNSKTFERIDGEIEIRGIPFKYVKRRIYNDSLEMLCIPNAAAIKLQTAKNEFFKFVNDLQQEKKSEPRSRAYKTFSINYYISDGLMQIGDRYFTSCQKAAASAVNILSCYLLTEEHPPQHC